MKWNELFKIVGPNADIKQSKNGYSMVLKNRTIIRFDDFSMECKSIELGLNDTCVLFGETIKKINLKEYSKVKLINIP